MSKTILTAEQSEKTKSTKRKAAIFARVSTARQEKEGLSLSEIQLPRAKKYAEENNLEVAEVFSVSETGGQYKIRKKFHEMVEHVKKHKDITDIIVFRVDRITRNFHDAVIIDDLRLKNGKRIHFIDDHFVLDKDSKRNELLQWDMKVLIARQYLEGIKEDGQNSKMAKLKAGQLPWNAPYGYKNVTLANGDRSVILDGHKSHIAREAYRRYATGTYSVQSLAKELNKEFGTNFHKNNVYRILTNKFNIGLIVDKQTGKEYPHIYETLIDRETFDRVQDILEGHSTKRQRYYGVEATYRAMMTCSECGCTLTPDPKKKVQKNGNIHRYLYYRCTNGKGQHTGCVHSISETKLDAIMLDLLEQLRPPKERMAVLKKELVAKHAEKNEFYDKRRAELATRKQRIKERQRALFDTFMDSKAGGGLGITQEDYDENNIRYAEELAEIEKRQRQLDEVDQSYYVTVSYLLNLFEHAADIFKVAKVNEKRQILSLLLSNLQFDGENVHYTLKEPFEGLFLCPGRSIWLGMRDSNPRMLGPEPSALPLGESPTHFNYIILFGS